MIIDRATYDDPHRYPAGIGTVIVNGVVVVDSGQHTGTLPGRVRPRGPGGSPDPSGRPAAREIMPAFR